MFIINTIIVLYTLFGVGILYSGMEDFQIVHGGSEFTLDDYQPTRSDCSVLRPVIKYYFNPPKPPQWCSRRDVCFCELNLGPSRYELLEPELAFLE